MIALIALPLALSTTLPTFARLIAGPGAHVCHCDRGHTSCACPICHPDRDDLKLNADAIRGTCGDDDIAFGASQDIAILPSAGVTFMTPIADAMPRPLAAHPPIEITHAPPTPPPRASV
jgi:hypothetical protein